MELAAPQSKPLGLWLSVEGSAIRALTGIQTCRNGIEKDKLESREVEVPT